MKLSRIEARIEALPPVRALGVRLLKVHQMIYERSGGRIGHRLGPTRSLLLRTVGAKTGKQRTTALTYAKDGGDYIVVASLGGAPRSPGWYHNLRAHPDVEIQIGTRRMRALATPVLAGDPDRERLWQLADRHNGGRYAQYQSMTSRAIPVVRLTPLR
jgi:deazaflavin-dependent oxidoreductase (nitroreductase family)